MSLHRLVRGCVFALFTACLFKTPSLLAVVYHVGPGQNHASLSTVPWSRLTAGDEVQIHWRVEPYREKIVLSSRGAPGAPIRITGIPSPSGELPVIDGDGANSVPEAVAPLLSEALGIILICRGQESPSDFKPGYIEVSNLQLRRAQPSYEFIARNSSRERYGETSAGVYAFGVEHLVVKGCVITECGNGLVIESGTSSETPNEAAVSRDIQVQNCSFRENQGGSEYSDANVSIEAIGTILEFNRFEAAPLGSNVIDRSAGTVVRYNWFEGGNSALQLVQPVYGAPIVSDHPTYAQSYVYGNVMITGPSSSELVRYGGELNLPMDNFRGGTLFFYHNTVVVRSDGYSFDMIPVSLGQARLEIANNIVFREGQSQEFSLATLNGECPNAALGTRTVVGPNWISQEWNFCAASDQASRIIRGEMAGFLNSPGNAFSLTANSPAIDTGDSLPGDRFPPADQEYVTGLGAKPRRMQGALPDLGAFEFLNPTGGRLQFSAANYEIEESSNSIVLGVERQGSSQGEAQVQFVTQNGSARSGIDFAATEGVLTWGDGEVGSKSFAINLFKTSGYTGDRTFQVVLRNPSGQAILGSPQETLITIRDVDPVTTLQFSRAEYMASEPSGKVAITVTRTRSFSGPVNVEFFTSPAEASPESDYVPTTGILNWADGEDASKTFEVQIVPDAFEEEPQRFLVHLRNPTRGILGPIRSAEVSIQDFAVQMEYLNEVYPAPGNLLLQARVAGATAPQVEFLEGDQVLGRASGPDANNLFSFEWREQRPGLYTVRARGIDQDGTAVLSAPSSIFLAGPAKDVGRGICHVDARNLTGFADGSAKAPFRSIQQGIEAAAPGGVVKVAAGIYREHLAIQNISLQLLAGYPGGQTSDYAAGREGDFSSRHPQKHPVQVNPFGRRTAIGLNDARDTLIDGFEIFGAAHGVLITGSEISSSFPTLRQNVIRDNGERFRSHGGGGVHAQNSSLTLIRNNIINNTGGRGGAVSSGGIGASIVVRNNLIKGNIGCDDHGGGLYIMANGVISGNWIEGNRVGDCVEYGGWGGGLIIFGNSSDFFPVITLSNNIVTGNFAGSGSAEFFDEGVQATVEHELIYKNEAPPNGGGAILVDGCCNTKVVFNFCTVVENETASPGGNGITCDTSSSAEIINSIFWNNGSTEFVAIEPATLRISYTLSGKSIVTGNNITTGPGNLQGDPLFADPANGNYRLKTTRGRWSLGPSGGLGSWVKDGVNSPALDAADPAADFSWEASPHGGRADLGAYGRRAEVGLVATLESSGLLKLTAHGVNTFPYLLQSSGDLQTWRDAGSLNSATGSIEHFPPTPGSSLFYRMLDQ